MVQKSYAWLSTDRILDDDCKVRIVYEWLWEILRSCLLTLNNIMFSVDSPWDRLTTAVVGSCWSPSRFDWVDYHVRQHLEIIAQETQEDLDALASLLVTLGVQVLRPNLDCVPNSVLPPVAPRDDLILLHNRLCVQSNSRAPGYQHIVDLARGQDVIITRPSAPDIHGANVLDLPDCVYYSVDHIEDLPQAEHWFEQYVAKPRRRYYNTGHLDGWWCIPTPGVIAASRDHAQHALQKFFFKQHFPDHTVLYLNETFAGTLDRKWHSDQHPPHSEFAQWVNATIPSWVGCAAETVFEINILIIDHTLVITGQDHPELRDLLKQKGCHLLVAPLRHQTFWDLGIHCATADLARIRNSN